MRTIDESSKVEARGYSRAHSRRSWTDGDVVTPWGIVSVYAQGDDANFYVTRLDFVHGGRLHIRTFSGKRYSLRGIKTKAMQFAREIAETE